MKRLLLFLTVAGAALLAPGLAQAQEKPVLNSAPPVLTPVPMAPAPAPAAPTPVAPDPAPADAVAPAPALPSPSYSSPSGFDLPEREQKRKAAQAQAEQNTKLFLYGGIGLGLSSYYGQTQFNGSISPALGYRLNDRLAIGPGISYSYNSTSFGQGNPSLHLHNVGVKAFAQLRVIDKFFLHAEYEVTRAELPVTSGNSLVLVNNEFQTYYRRIETPLAGVGYRSQISNRAAADIVVLYNFKDNYDSIYPNPVIRFNFLYNIGK